MHRASCSWEGFDDDLVILGFFCRKNMGMLLTKSTVVGLGQFLV